MGSAMRSTGLLLGILALYGVLNLPRCVNGSSMIESDEEDSVTKPDYNDTMANAKDPDAYIAPPDFIETNPSELPDGTVLTEGDMLLTEDEVERIYSQTHDRKAINPDIYNRPAFPWNARWPANSQGNVIIKYRIACSSAKDTPVIKSALEHWKQHTCLSFQQVFTDGPFSHIYFIKRDGCYSKVGRYPGLNGKPAGQVISIGERCAVMGTVVHEVGHAIGFVHEHSRTDRDNYVRIFLENVNAIYHRNFRKELKSHNHSVPYDYTSIMHYGDRVFSNNTKVTLSPIDPSKTSLIGQRIKLSFRDIKLANIIYNCIEKWMQKCRITKNPCMNEGYVGKDCKCVCRPGTTGRCCERITGSYYSTIPFGGVVTRAGRIASPGFPSRRHRAVSAVWRIKAPVCQIPKVTITAFRAYVRTGGICRIEGLEVRTSSLYTGRTYCGKGSVYNPNNQDLNPGRVFMGSGRELLLNFYSRYLSNTGFSATVQFVQSQSASCKPTTSIPVMPTPPPDPCTLPMTVTSTPNCQLRRLGNSWWWSRHIRPRSRSSCLLRVGTRGCPKKVRIYFQYLPCRLWSTFCLIHTPLFTSNRYHRYCSRNPVCKFAGSVQMTAPTSNFQMADTIRYWRYSRSRPFRIMVSQVYSPCHKRIVLSPTTPAAVIRSEDARGGENCEWFVQAPSGRRIRMIFRRWLLHRLCYRPTVYRPRPSIFKRRYWWGTCRRNHLSCSRGRGGLLISTTGNVYYNYIRPLCSSRLPRAITSFRNQISISYQRIVRYRRTNWIDWYLRRGKKPRLPRRRNLRKRPRIRSRRKWRRTGRWRRRRRRKGWRRPRWWYCRRSRYCRRWSFVQSFPLVFEAMLILV